MLSQKEAVFGFVTELSTFNGDVAVPTKDERAEIIDRLVYGFQAGEISMDNAAILADATKLRQYASGLLTNWLKKDVRLNGGTKYVPKSTGTRVSDPQIKEMRKLLSTVTDPMDRAVVEAEIAKRQAEINAAKAPTIDFSVLPASLAAKFNSK